jgi:hypothetical protein
LCKSVFPLKRVSVGELCTLGKSIRAQTDLCKMQALAERSRGDVRYFKNMLNLQCASDKTIFSEHPFTTLENVFKGRKKTCSGQTQLLHHNFLNVCNMLGPERSLDTLASCADAFSYMDCVNRCASEEADYALSRSLSVVSVLRGVTFSFPSHSKVTRGDLFDSFARDRQADLVCLHKNT